MRSSGACLWKEVPKAGICASRGPFCDKSAFICTLPVLVLSVLFFPKTAEKARGSDYMDIGTKKTKKRPCANTPSSSSASNQSKIKPSVLSTASMHN